MVKKPTMKYQLVLKVPASVLGGKFLWKFGLSWVTFFPYNDFSTIQISRPNSIFSPPKFFHHTVTICNVLFQLIVNYFQISDQITVYKTVTASQLAFFPLSFIFQDKSFWVTICFLFPTCLFLLVPDVPCLMQKLN